ncbi:MAG: efflux RND transporter periplasmic adaptor subunit [Acidobacteria bacterium]|nr:efflux RND transporter periplasmic adaptor subunit [Acidobacteriota bacterium]MYD72562.1 efflux RND transporter periplasmic adaptor subunit [Acidobacteriota bacterium]MYJ05453.1 efflux RND transporter periplasmic adaptor subunit [Acidobacteriota bacterium]
MVYGVRQYNGLFGMTTKRLVIGIVIVVLAAALVAVNLWYRRSNAAEVDIEMIERRNLIAIVSAPGTIQPQLLVEMSASTMGRVTRLAVDEGDPVDAGQFLLEIDPENLQALVDRGEASLEATRAAYRQAQVAVETATVNLELARENLDRQADLWELRLVAREVYEQTEADVQVRETELRQREVEVEAAMERIRQEEAALDSARYDLTQVTITSPINGIVTRRNIDEGETVVIGTMNNPGTVLLEIADFSVLEAEIEVDETDIPAIELGQRAEITIDALPDKIWTGTVTEIGNSPIQQAGGATTQEATNFLVVVTLDEIIPNVRPGFTCTAEITTATRQAAIAVPIQATTVREMDIDSDGNIIRQMDGEDDRNRGGVPFRLAGDGASAPGVADAAAADTEELEGVFAVRQGRAMFIPVQTGIAGDRYFEALSGLAEGDEVITGPFEVVRNLEDGDPVAPNDPDAG